MVINGDACNGVVIPQAENGMVQTENREFTNGFANGIANNGFVQDHV